MDNDIARYKRTAAEYAVQAVESGMVVGLGHGSTAVEAVRGIAALLASGKLQEIRGIPCSKKVEHEAVQYCIPVTTLEEHPVIDLTIDGADEVTPTLDVIKGHGGALLRERIVSQASKRKIIIVDDSKVSDILGTRALVPVEVIPFGWRSQALYLESLGARWVLRVGLGGTPILTDQQNYILDCDFGPLPQADGLALQLQARGGIVAHGLFLGMMDAIVIAGKDGIREWRRKDKE